MRAVYVQSVAFPMGADFWNSVVETLRARVAQQVVWSEEPQQRLTLRVIWVGGWKKKEGILASLPSRDEDDSADPEANRFAPYIAETVSTVDFIFLVYRDLLSCNYYNVDRR